MSTFGHAFLPGPTDVRPEIFNAMLEPMYFHYGPRMQALLAGMQPTLRAMFGTRQPVFIETCSASALMEAAIRNGVRTRVLVVVGGFFGDMFAQVASACGKEVVRANVHPGQVITPDQLAIFLDGPPVDAVALVHSESSTGALAPLRALGEVIRRQPDVHLLVDGVTSLGALPVDVDAWGVDYIFTGSQKALALPPGIALGTASPRFVDRARSMTDRGWYFSVPDLMRIAEEGLLTHTPSLPHYHALAAQVRAIEAGGGLAARWARHAEMLQVMEQWIDTTPGTRLLAEPGFRSPAISAVELPIGQDARQVHAALADIGWTVALGLPPATDRILRIGHMGDLEPVHLRGLLEALSDILAHTTTSPQPQGSS